MVNEGKRRVGGLSGHICTPRSRFPESIGQPEPFTSTVWPPEQFHTVGYISRPIRYRNHIIRKFDRHICAMGVEAWGMKTRSESEDCQTEEKQTKERKRPDGRLVKGEGI